MQRKRNYYTIIYILIVLVGIMSVGCNNKTKQEILLDIINTPISPLSSVQLKSWLSENSGMILLKDTVWLQNDSSEPVLYGIDTLSGAIISQIEAICQKEGYKCYVTREGFFKSQPELYVFDFTTYINAIKSLKD